MPCHAKHRRYKNASLSYPVSQRSKVKHYSMGELEDSFPVLPSSFLEDDHSGVVRYEKGKIQKGTRDHRFSSKT